MRGGNRSRAWGADRRVESRPLPKACCTNAQREQMAEAGPSTRAHEITHTLSAALPPHDANGRGRREKPPPWVEGADGAPPMFSISLFLPPPIKLISRSRVSYFSFVCTTDGCVAPASFLPYSCHTPVAFHESPPPCSTASGTGPAPTYNSSSSPHPPHLTSSAAPLRPRFLLLASDELVSFILFLCVPPARPRPVPPYHRPQESLVES